MPGQYIVSLALACIPVTPWWPECNMSSMSLLRPEGTTSLSPQATALSTVSSLSRIVKYPFKTSGQFRILSGSPSVTRR